MIWVFVCRKNAIRMHYHSSTWVYHKYVSTIQNCSTQWKLTDFIFFLKAMGCSCNSTLLQLNTFANQLFCNTKPLQLVHFVTHVFATQRFWSLFLWCPFPQLLFAQECLFTCFFSNSLFRIWFSIWRILSEVSMGNNSFQICSFLMVVII